MASAVDTYSINIFHENEYIFLNKEGDIYHTNVEVDYVKDDIRKHKILYLISNPEEDSDKIDQIKKIYEKNSLEYVLKSENRFFNSKKTFSEDDLTGCATCLKLGKVNLNAEVLKKILNVFHKTFDYKQRFFANSNYIISISSKSKFFEDINHDICVHNSRVANNKKISKAKVVIYPNSTGYFTIPGLRIKHGQFKQLTTSLFFDSKQWFLVERVKIFKEKRNRGLSLKIIQNLKTISSFSFDVDKPIVINIVKKSPQYLAYSARLDLFEFLNPYFKFNYEKSSYQGFIDFYGQSNNAQIKETISGFLDLSICITNNLKKLINEGMVHCDIKPENILIDHDGMLKITDFDMMLHIDKAIGIPQLMGTKGYRKEGLEYRNETTEVYDRERENPRF